MSDRPKLAKRIWLKIRELVILLAMPDQAESDRYTQQGKVHPRQEQQGRTFQGGIS